MNSKTLLSRPDLLLLHAALIADSLPCKSIAFMLVCYDRLSEWKEGCSRVELAEVYGCTPQAASKHIRKLVAAGYLKRPHYRAWVLENSKISQIARDK